MDGVFPRYLVAFDTFRLPHHFTDVLVVGTGVAGYRAALAAAGAGRRVIQICKGKAEDCNTGYAQGGVAAAIRGNGDSPEKHAEDTLRVGQGLCDEVLVRRVMDAGEEAVRALVDMGAHFDKAIDDPDQGLEGGHSAPRVFHARGDATGAEIRDTLAATSAKNAKIDRWEDAYLVDLLTAEGVCRGALVYNRGRLRAIWAASTILASGGYTSQVWVDSALEVSASADIAGYIEEISGISFFTFL